MTFEDIWQGLRELVPSFITALPVAIVIILGGVLINLVASRALGAGWLTFLDSGHRIIYAIRDGLTAELTLTLHRSIMNIGQRVILWLGVLGLFLVWLLPPSYHVHLDGMRLETSWHWIWNLPHEWSINTPLVAWRIVTVVLITTAA